MNLINLSIIVALVFFRALNSARLEMLNSCNCRVFVGIIDFCYRQDVYWKMFSFSGIFMWSSNGQVSALPDEGDIIYNTTHFDFAAFYVVRSWIINKVLQKKRRDTVVDRLKIKALPCYVCFGNVISLSAAPERWEHGKWGPCVHLFHLMTKKTLCVRKTTKEWY